MQKLLFTNAGRRTYLVQFALELQASGYPIEVHVSDCSVLSASMHVSPRIFTHVLPAVLEDPDAYIQALFDLVARAGITLVFPLSDLDPLLLAQNRERFLDLGCRLVVASADVIERCNDKRLTDSYCRDVGLRTPKSWFALSDFDGAYPVLQKRIFGSGSVGLRHIHSQEDLNGFVSGRDMLQETIDGDEFGLDILSSLEGDPVAVCVKQKLLMRAGETDKARVVRDQTLEELGWLIARTFRHIGNLDCDVLRARDGSLYCIDFNARFGGGYPTTHLAGLNYLKAIVDMDGGRPVSLPMEPRLISVMKGISLHWFENS